MFGFRAEHSCRPCKLPARLQEYVLPHCRHPPGKMRTAAQAAPPNPAKQAWVAPVTAGSSKQKPTVPIRRLVVKLTSKPTVPEQGTALQLRVKQSPLTTPDTLTGQKPRRLAPTTDTSLHKQPSSMPTRIQSHRIAPVERPVTRHFKLHQRCSLKIRIKLKKTVEPDQRPQRLSSLKHQQKRHVHQARPGLTTMHQSLPPDPAAQASSSLKQEPMRKELPKCILVQPQLASETTSGLTALQVPDACGGRSQLTCSASNDSSSVHHAASPSPGQLRIKQDSLAVSTECKAFTAHPAVLSCGGKPPAGASKGQHGHHSEPAQLPKSAQHVWSVQQAGVSEPASCPQYHRQEAAHTITGSLVA